MEGDGELEGIESCNLEFRLFKCGCKMLYYSFLWRRVYQEGDCLLFWVVGIWRQFLGCRVFLGGRIVYRFFKVIFIELDVFYFGYIFFSIRVCLCVGFFVRTLVFLGLDRFFLYFEWLFSIWYLGSFLMKVCYMIQ